MRAWRPSRLFLVLSLGVFLASLDQTVVVTVLPSLMLDLGVPVTRFNDAAWVVTAYLLGFTVAMPLFGRLGDLFGHHRLYAGAMATFSVGSVLVATAGNLPWLIAARSIQAIGGGALLPAAIALATRDVAFDRRSVVLGVLGAAAEAGAVLGPLVGGIIANALGWRWVFWLNVPAALALLAMSRGIRPSPAAAGDVDARGALLLTAGLLLLTLGLSQRGLLTSVSPTAYGLLATGVCLLILLRPFEARVKAPLLPLGLFRARHFTAAMGAQLLVGAALILALATVPLMADIALGSPPLEGGLRLMRLTGAIPFGALLGGYVAGRLGNRPVTVTGLVACAAGLLLMSTWTLDIRDPSMSLHLAITGFGFGLVIAPLTTTAVNAAPPGYAGTAAALITVARLLGMTLGLAAVSAWGIDRFQQLASALAFPLPGLGETAAVQQRRLTEYQAGLSAASVALFQRFFLAGAVLSLAACVPALWMGGKRTAQQARDG